MYVMWLPHCSTAIVAHTYHAGTVGRSSFSLYESSSTFALISIMPVSVLNSFLVTRMGEYGTRSTCTRRTTRLS
jgi:hypothetical protein